MSKKIEDWEISLVECVFERFSQWTQKWFGLDCFFWSFIVTVVAVIATATLVLINIMEKHILMASLWIVVIIGYFITMMYTIPTKKSFCYSELLKGSKNIFLITDSAIRLSKISWAFLLSPLILLSLILAPERWLETSFVFFAVCGTSYPQWAFMGCTPLPPGQSKLRKGVKKMREMVEKALAPGNGGLPAPA